MKPNLWWMLAWLASAWKSTRISWLTWGPMSICAPALGPMLRLCMPPGSYGQGCWIWSQVDWSTATEAGSSVFVGREPRYQPGETYWAGVGQFEGGEAKLPPDTHQETWRLPSSPGTSTMNCWWAWKSSKCLAKQSWPWCQWQQQKRSLEKHLLLRAKQPQVSLEEHHLKKGPCAWKSTSICQGQAWKSQA